MKLTDAEWQIMNALWKGWPATGREIAGRLPKEVKWAYTTIKTMLTRLAEKGAVSEAKRGNVGVYEPLVSREEARRSAFRSMLDQAFEGAFGPLMHFLVEDERLTAAERREIREALEKQDGKRKGRK